MALVSQSPSLFLSPPFFVTTSECSGLLPIYSSFYIPLSFLLFHPALFFSPYPPVLRNTNNNNHHHPLFLSLPLSLFLSFLSSPLPLPVCDGFRLCVPGVHHPKTTTSSPSHPHNLRTNAITPPESQPVCLLGANPRLLSLGHGLGLRSSGIQTGLPFVPVRGPLGKKKKKKKLQRCFEASAFLSKLEKTDSDIRSV